MRDHSERLKTIFKPTKRSERPLVGAFVAPMAGKYAEFIGKDSTWETLFDERKEIEMFQDQAAASRRLATSYISHIIHVIYC